MAEMWSRWRDLTGVICDKKVLVNEDEGPDKKNTGSIDVTLRL